jgi:hypothetical protein
MECAGRHVAVRADSSPPAGAPGVARAGSQPARRDGDRAGSRSPPAVGRGECLVQVHVHDVESHVARADDTENGIEVGAVVVEQAPHLVHGRGNGLDVLLEEPQRVGVGQHDAGHVGVEHRAQRLQVDAATVVAGHGDRLVAAQGDRGRIGAVGRVRDDDAVAGLAPGFVVRPHQQQPGQFPGRSGGRLQGGRRHARSPRTAPLRARRRSAAIPGSSGPAPRVYPGQARPGRPRCRTAWGCTSWCTSPAGTHPGRPRTGDDSSG